MKKISVGILGCAEIAKRYAIPALLSLPGVELAAIASRSQSKASAWAEEYGAAPETYESLLERTDIDVIYSPLPIGLQEEWALKTAQAGKHMICEKSITYSYGSAQRMVDEYKRNGLSLYENFVPEFHSQHTEVLSLINTGAVGAIRIWSGSYGFPPFPENDIRYSSELKGGSLNDAGCYTLFMARKILQEEPIAVTCTLRNEGHAVDICGSALIEFPSASAHVSFGFDNLYQNTYTVWGSKGLIHVPRAYAIPPTLDTRVELITNDGSKASTKVIPIMAENQFAKSFDFFCRAVGSEDEKIREEMYSRILSQARAMEAFRISARESKRVLLEGV